MISSDSSDPQLPRYFQSKSQQNNSIKFSQLKNSLINCDTDFIINLLIQELEKTDKFQAQIKQMDKLLKLQEDEKQHLKMTLRQKKIAFKQVCQTQQKNIENIQQLQKQLHYLRHKCQISKDQTVYQQTAVEKKYKQLSKCMNEYVTNTADIQEQFKRNFFMLKNENIRLHAENQNLTMGLKQQSLTVAALSRQLKNIRILQQTASHLKSENQRLIKEIHHNKLIQKDLYTGVSSMQTQRIGLERELQKVRQICQNSNSTNRQISQKYQQLLRKYKQQEKQRLIIADNCKGSSERIKQLETCIMKEQQEYSHRESQIQKLKKMNVELERNSLQLISQTANLQKKLIESQTLIHNKNELEVIQTKNKQLETVIQQIQLQNQKERGKSDRICRQVQNFMNQPNIIMKSILKPSKDLSNIRSLKTMATSCSQSRVQKMNEQNIKPH